MKKIKFLILALLGIIIIPTATNAYELGASFNGSSSWPNPDPSYLMSGAYCLGNNGYFILGNEKNFILNEKNCIVGSYVAIPKMFYGFMWNSIPGVYRENIGEGTLFYYAVYDENRVRYRNYSIPSRTAFVQTIGGKEVMIDRIYYAPNQLFFYNNETWEGYSLLGNLRINGAMLIANPILEEDNVFLIQFNKKKAYSFTADFDLAYRIFLGKISAEEFASFQYAKAYDMVQSDINQSSRPLRLGSFYNYGMSSNLSSDRGRNYVEELGGLVNVPSVKIIGETHTTPATSKRTDKYGNTFSSKNECVAYYSDVRTHIMREDDCIDKSGTGSSNYTLAALGNPTEEYLEENYEKIVNPGKLECQRFMRVRRNLYNSYGSKREKLLQDSLSISYELEKKQKKALDFNPEQSCLILFKGNNSSSSSSSSSEEELEHNFPNNSAIEVLKDFFKSPLDYLQSFRDRFNNYDGQSIGVYSGKNYYNYDFQADSSKLRLLYEECFSTSWEYSILTKEDRMNSCRKYEELKLELGKVYSSMTGVNFSSGFQEYVNSLEKNNLNDDIGLGKRFISVISDPFYSGFNAVNFVAPVCSGTNYDFFNIFFYLFYFGAVLYIFKLFA